jgi:Nitronate monooxygenase
LHHRRHHVYHYSNHPTPKHTASDITGWHGLDVWSSLAAAVSNAGGLGVIGGVGYTVAMLKEMIEELKQSLDTPDLSFAVDLLIPQVEGSA